MKAMQCELCGATDIVKDDEFFVCQSCGMKYTLESAKKMMIEGVVQVEGTVKVDKGDEIDNNLQSALNHYHDGDYEQADKLFSRVLSNQPDNPIATLYHGLCMGWQGSYEDNKMKVTEAAFMRSVKYGHGYFGPSEEGIRFYVDALTDYFALCERCVARAEREGNDSVAQLNQLLFKVLRFDWQLKAAYEVMDNYQDVLSNSIYSLLKFDDLLCQLAKSKAVAPPVSSEKEKRMEEMKSKTNKFKQQYIEKNYDIEALVKDFARRAEQEKAILEAEVRKLKKERDSIGRINIIKRSNLSYEIESKEKDIDKQIKELSNPRNKIYTQIEQELREEVLSTTER